MKTMNRLGFVSRLAGIAALPLVAVGAVCKPKPLKFYVTHTCVLSVQSTTGLWGASRAYGTNMDLWEVGGPVDAMYNVPGRLEAHLRKLYPEADVRTTSHLSWEPWPEFDGRFGSCQFNKRKVTWAELYEYQRTS